MDKKLLSIGALLTLVAGQAQAAVPLSFTHHGVLKEDGVLVNEQRQVTVTIYAGNEAIAQKSEPVDFTDGHYSLTVDNIPVDKVAAANIMVLGINIDGEELLPRLQIKSVPYALVSSYAQTAGALDCENCISAKQLDFIAAEDFQLPSCQNNEVLRAQGDGWQCSTAVKIDDTDSNAPVTSLKGSVALNNLQEGTYPAGAYQYVATNVGAVQEDILPCFCDTDAAANCPVNGFYAVSSQGDSCYDALGGGSYRYFTLQDSNAPVPDMVVIKDGRLGMGTGAPAANIHVRATGGADNYEMVLADSQPEILLENSSPNTASYKLAVKDNNLEIYADDGQGQFSTQPALIINAQGLVINGTLNAAALDANLKINATNINMNYAKSDKPGGNATALADNVVTGSKIKDGEVTSADIANGTIATADMADNAITNAKLADSSISSTKLADNSVTNEKLDSSLQKSIKLANSALQKIGTGYITNEMLGSKIVSKTNLDSSLQSSINKANSALQTIADNSITSAMIATGAVGSTELADLSVTSAKIANGAVGTNQLAGTSVTSAKIANGAVGSTQLAKDSVILEKLSTSLQNSISKANSALQGIADNSITSAMIATGAVGSTELADLSITSDKIANGAVGTDQLAGTSVTSAKIANGAVGTNQLAGTSVTTAKIANGAVGTNQLAGTSVTTEKIADGAVGTNQLAGSSVTNAKLANSAVTNAKMASKTVSQTKMRNLAPAVAWGNITYTCANPTKDSNGNITACNWTISSEFVGDIASIAKTATTSAVPRIKITFADALNSTKYTVLSDSAIVDPANSKTTTTLYLNGPTVKLNASNQPSSTNFYFIIYGKTKALADEEAGSN